jgi:hypothetical protein
MKKWTLWTMLIGGFVLLSIGAFVGWWATQSQGWVKASRAAAPNGKNVGEAQETREVLNGIQEVDIVFQSDGFQLSGTVTLPQDAEAPVPAVLLLGDAGYVDRNGNGLGINVNFFKVLAHRLAARGIGSLRYDKRGVGKSEGKIYKASFQDLVTDAFEALKFLRDRPEIDETRVFLLGHGEGAEIAALVASQQSAIKGLILVAGPGRPLDQIRLDRIRLQGELLQWSPEKLKEALKWEEGFIAFVKQSQGEWEDYSFEQVKEVLPWLDRQRFAVMKVFALSWYRQHFFHDPAATLRGVNVPLLLIHGDKDHLYPVEEAERLAKAAEEGGNPSVQVQTIANLNHLMRPSERISFTDFNLEEPVDERVLRIIEEWVLVHSR